MRLCDTIDWNWFAASPRLNEESFLLKSAGGYAVWVRLSLYPLRSRIPLGQLFSQTTRLAAG